MSDVALVCGASGALGSALVEALAARGDRVIAVDRHGGEPVDLTVPEDVEALWERLEARGDRPRWVVNSVGGYRGGSVAESEPDEVRFVEELNLATAWWSCRAAARRLEPGGAIVNVASRSAVAGSGAAAYSVAKAGVVRLTEILAAELSERKIRVNAVLPATIDTPQNRETMSPEQLRKAVPPAEIAAVVAFLCSDAAAAVTGAAIPAYGWA